MVEELEFRGRQDDLLAANLHTMLFGSIFRPGKASLIVGAGASRVRRRMARTRRISSRGLKGLVR
jgi:hypothetical protein